jgi:hypothetical protein
MKLGIVETMIVNDLAREFYGLMGYDVESGYRFDKANHPTEKLMFVMAKTAYVNLKDIK